MEAKHSPLYTAFDIRDLIKIKSDDPDLIRAQVESVSRQLPALYACITVNILLVSLSFLTVAPRFLTVYIPAAVVVFSIIRMFSWMRTHAVAQSHEQRIKHLKRLLILTAALCICLSAWALALFEYGNAFQQGHIAFFISITLVACIYATVQFPPAAVLALAIVGTVFVVKFMLSQNPIFMAMALNFVFVCVIIFRIIQSYYGIFIGLISSRAHMTRQNKEMRRMNQELEFRRDHLEAQVKERTRQIQEQALQLEVALEGERELNQMQNQFISVVSHEFRTPLTIIDATARRIEKQADTMEPDALRSKASGIRESIKRLSNMVDRTLDASQLAEGKLQIDPKPFDLRALLQDVITRHSEIAPGHTIISNLEHLPGEIVGDATLLDNVFSNLMSNAIKYSKNNPKISIETKSSETGCTIVVRDHGVGIPKSELSKITNRFFRASTSEGIQGTGIGLNLVKAIVEQHGGTFHLDSQESKWTEAIVELPIAASVITSAPVQASA